MEISLRDLLKCKKTKRNSMKFIILLNAVFTYIHTYSSVTWEKMVGVSLCRNIVRV